MRGETEDIEPDHRSNKRHPLYVLMIPCILTDYLILLKAKFIKAALSKLAEDHRREPVGECQS
jgi:hypothetical protein